MNAVRAKERRSVDNVPAGIHFHLTSAGSIFGLLPVYVLAQGNTALGPLKG